MRRSKRSAWCGAATIACAFLCGAPGASAEVPGGTACRVTIAGTYLVTIHADAGAYASRALATIHGDGTLIVADSRQHQGVHGSSFGAQQGTYRCAGPRAAQAMVLNFGYPPQPSIARSDWSIAYDPATASISGMITLFIFPGVERVDPFAAGGKPMGVFRFTSARVMPPAR